MNTLLIDTHADFILIAYYQNDIIVDKCFIEEKSNRSSLVIPSILSLLNKLNITIHDIDDFVVINGPGSFTGERIGVTIAKTLAYTLKKQIRTLTSLEMYLDNSVTTDYVALTEKNGYYIGKLENNQLTDYFYLSIMEYNKWRTTHSSTLLTCINYVGMITKAHQKSPLNPHEVNPFYVKKIEVEK